MLTPDKRAERMLLTVVIFDTFTLGFITLGFEMIAGRIMTPLFGSGIYTWATIISLVVAGLMCGYYAGGFFADHTRPSAWPRYKDFLRSLPSLRLLFGRRPAGKRAVAFRGRHRSLFASGFIVCFPPLLMLGMFSPLAVRLLLDDPAIAGRVSGGLFALSALGNIFGILSTTFLLVPHFGSRAITASFAIFVLASGILSIFARALTPRRVDAI